MAAPVIAQVVTPQPNVRFTQLYKLRYLAAQSIADVLRRSFANVQIAVLPEVNGITVVATAAEHRRIADALAQLDVPPHAQTPAVAATAAPADASAAGGGPVDVEVLTLHAAVPGINGAPSSSAADIANVVMQALSPSLPDLHITVYATQSQLLLTGSPSSIRAAHALIDKLDALPKLVVLDVTIVEVDETVAKNLGLSLQPALISSTYTETTPAVPLAGGTAPPLLGLQPFSRTPLSIGLQLNLLIQNGTAKVLADPKLTTLSGRTASIRAGDNIAILTTTGGSVGTVATTQLVTFNTGVQLDITPVINADNFITVTLHPTVNNLASVANGVPQISTRDAQTTVAMHEGQSLIIGGLIEDSYNRTEQRVPILGYLPIVGKFFTNTTVNGQRNELIITVTPHIVDPLGVAPPVGPAMTELPAPVPLPTVAPATVVPAPQRPSPAPTPPPSVGNAFTYGQRPASVPLVGPNDPPRILYARVAPQLVKTGTTVSAEVVTTPNVTRLVMQLGAATVALHQDAPGIWTVTVPASIANALPMGAPVPAHLTAARADGITAALDIPLVASP